MSRKIATPVAVFAACDQLDTSGKPWNRDDVRIAVGGGGFSVIDPLIQAWRKLKPVKALASSTPTALLHQVAEALEVHFSQHMSDVEHRETERTRIFESTIDDVSERLSSVEVELEQANTSNLELAEERSRLADEIEEHHRNRHEKERALLKLQAENDELGGLTQRLEKQNGALAEQYKLDRKSLENKHESNIASILREHKSELSKEKKELTERNEQAENRLMLLLDQERTDARKQIKTSAQERDLFRKKETDAKEQTIKFKIECQGLHDKVDAMLQEKEKLNASLAKAESRYDTLHDEHLSFQKDNESVKFEELRSTVLALQESLKTK